MSLFPLPTPADVLDDSGLRFEQINPKYTAEQTTIDIAQKIGESASLVEMKLRDASQPYSWPISSLSEDYQDLQIQNATLIVKWFALSYVYRRSGQLIAKYEEKADKYEKSAEDFLKSMCDSLKLLAKELKNNSKGINEDFNSLTIIEIPLSNQNPNCFQYTFYD